MLSDRVSNPGTLTYESEALPIALRSPAAKEKKMLTAGTIGTYGHTEVALFQR